MAKETLDDQIASLMGKREKETEKQLAEIIAMIDQDLISKIEQIYLLGQNLPSIGRGSSSKLAISNFATVFGHLNSVLGSEK